MADNPKDPAARIRELEAENESLKAAAKKRDDLDKRVVEKMAAGLSREHAEQAVKFQDLTDAQEAEEKAKAVAKAKQAEPAAAKATK